MIRLLYLLALPLTLLLTVNSYAAEDISPSTSDGCGLGWQVTDKRTLSATTTRGTTNAIIPPSFGMTTGTIDCERHDIVKNKYKTLHFVAANLEELQAELAVGQGENLNKLAEHFGCEDLGHFGQFTQSSYERIIPSADQSANDFIQNLNAVMPAGCNNTII